MSFQRRSPSQSVDLVRKNKTSHNKSIHSPIKINVLQHKINTKKLKPGLVTAYNIRPGNGEALFCFYRFILTDLLKTLNHLLTAPGPTRGIMSETGLR